jgi:hypothetical protein
MREKQKIRFLKENRMIVSKWSNKKCASGGDDAGAKYEEWCYQFLMRTTQDLFGKNFMPTGH